MDIIIGIIIGLAMGYVFFKSKRAHAPEANSGNRTAREQEGEGSSISLSETGEEKMSPQKQMEDNLSMVLQMFEANNRITNDDVQVVLGVVDSTATKYLDELKKRGEIEQRDDIEQGVYYVRIKTG